MFWHIISPKKKIDLFDKYVTKYVQTLQLNELQDNPIKLLKTQWRKICLPETYTTIKILENA
jgi:hypothetical protein